MKVYTKIVYDKDDNVIEQHSYDYDGPVSHARKIPRYRASKSPTSNIKTIDEQANSRSKAVNDKIKKNFYDNDANFTAGGITAADYNAQEDYRSRQYDNSNNPTISGDGTGKKKRVVVDISEPNQLFNYASYNVLFTLSAIGQGELENTKLLMQSAPHDIIARSSGIGPNNPTGPAVGNINDEFGTNGSTGVDPNDKIINASGNARLKGALKKSQATLAMNRDIYFKSVNMNAIPGPNEKRRLTGVTQIKIELIEPAGISLLEKVRGAAYNNGYLDHLGAPFLLTMNFAGFDELGNTITDKVKGSLDRRIPIKLVDMDMSVTSAGTSYILTAIPMNEYQFVNNYNYPRTTGKLSLTVNRTIGGVVKELEKALNKQNEDERDAGLIEHPDVYEISINEKLNPGAPISRKSIQEVGMFATENQGPQGSGSQDYLKFNQNYAVIKILEEIMKGHPDFTDESFNKKKEGFFEKLTTTFVPAYDFDEAPTEDFYYDYFKISGSVIPTSKFDYIRNKNVKKLIYTIEPYKVNAMSLAIPGTNAGQNFKSFVHKKYNYIFTGENTDILDLDIKYRVAYFQSRLKDVDPSDSRGDVIVDSNDPKNTPSSTTKGLGSDGNFLLSSEPSGVKSGSTGKTGGTAPILDAFLDSLTHPLADMVVIRMTILGDPAYLGQSQFIPATPQSSGDGTHTDTNIDYFHGSSGKVWNSKLHCFNEDLAEPVVLLNFRMPTDINDQTGVYDMRSDQSAEFSGLYRVVQVEHSFNDGRYTNVLSMTRFNNQGVDVVSDPQALLSVAGKLISTSEFKDLAKNFVSGTFDDLTNSVKRKFKDKLSSILKN